MIYLQLTKQEAFFQSKTNICFRAELCQNWLNIWVSLEWHIPTENCLTRKPLTASGPDADLEPPAERCRSRLVRTWGCSWLGYVGEGTHLQSIPRQVCGGSVSLVWALPLRKHSLPYFCGLVPLTCFSRSPLTYNCAQGTEKTSFFRGYFPW